MEGLPPRGTPHDSTGSPREADRFYFFFDPRDEPCFCDRALPAADFDAAPVRPVRRVFDAALAAGSEVFFDVPACERALPAADFEVFEADPLRSVFEALLAALLPVCFRCAMGTFPARERILEPVPNINRSSAVVHRWMFLSNRTGNCAAHNECCC